MILERDCLKGGDNTCVRVSRGTAKVLPSDRFTRGKRRIMNVSLYHTAREITSKPACGARRATITTKAVAINNTAIHIYVCITRN